jgi:hypothetical protein
MRCSLPLTDAEALRAQARQMLTVQPDLSARRA